MHACTHVIAFIYPVRVNGCLFMEGLGAWGPFFFLQGGPWVPFYEVLEATLVRNKSISLMLWLLIGSHFTFSQDGAYECVGGCSSKHFPCWARWEAPGADQAMQQGRHKVPDCDDETRYAFQNSANAFTVNFLRLVTPFALCSGPVEHENHGTFCDHALVK